MNATNNGLCFSCEIYIRLLNVKFMSIDFAIITGPMESFRRKSTRGQIPKVWHKACICVNPDDVNLVVTRLIERNLWRATTFYKKTFPWITMHENDSQPFIFWRRPWVQEKLNKIKKAALPSVAIYNLCDVWIIHRLTPWSQVTQLWKNQTNLRRSFLISTCKSKPLKLVSIHSCHLSGATTFQHKFFVASQHKINIQNIFTVLLPCNTCVDRCDVFGCGTAAVFSLFIRRKKFERQSERETDVGLGFWRKRHAVRLRSLVMRMSMWEKK